MENEKFQKKYIWIILLIIALLAIVFFIIRPTDSNNKADEEHLDTGSDSIDDEKDKDSDKGSDKADENDKEEPTEDNIEKVQFMGPNVAGFEGEYYIDFEDTDTPHSMNWGFITQNATVNINKDDIAGNSTSKLAFIQIYQSDGRVATKQLDTPVTGDSLFISFDWFPGEINDKESSAEENGGELRLLDSSNNVIFTLNNTNGSALTAFTGNNETKETFVTDPEKWYTFEIKMDLLNNNIDLKVEDKESNNSETYVLSLAGVDFDSTVEILQLVGMRTPTNNITWTTYLDNLGIYNTPLPDDRIINVDPMPYHRVYVGDTTKDPETINIPDKVVVTTADGKKEEVTVKEWHETGTPWDPDTQGIYEFKGILDDSDELDNGFNRLAHCYVYNRLKPSDTARQAEWLDRAAIALKSDDGVFVSWRLLATEYDQDITFDIYRGQEKLNSDKLSLTNFSDNKGKSGDTYTIETFLDGDSIDKYTTTALDDEYLSIPMQRPEGGVVGESETEYVYYANDTSVGDLDGDGEYEIIVKWIPSNGIDSAQSGRTGPTIFDAYKLDGTLLWRIDMGLNLTSGAHYNQFIVADLDGDGKSEFFIKTADATTVYGTTNGKYDSNKVISVIGNPDDNGKWIYNSGHVHGGPEYISVFDGETGKEIDTIDYRFPVGNPFDWGDSNYNRSDRFLATLAYLDGKTPSVVFNRGYYERTTFVAYNLVNDKIEELWHFDSVEEERGGGLGNHNIAAADIDNDGCDEIIAGSLTLDNDGTILYAMDGEMGRTEGSHGDALHVGAFDPDREGIHVYGVHEVSDVASLEYHDGATGETLMSYFAYRDAGRGVAANITSEPGYEFWGAGGAEVESGGGIYNVQGHVISESSRDAFLSMNFTLYWDGDLLHELLDDIHISKYSPEKRRAELVTNFQGVVSNNGTKATPSLQADILGDWREEVLLPTPDGSELRVYSTTIPTEYRIYTLMHDPTYRNGVAWQNVAYNQPPHIGFYLGEDIRDQVLDGNLTPPNIYYTNEDR